ncbi:hypothetical protein LCGC14_1733170 [marine sediment metagenome]|uniref:Site-specific DNA-methyltransferase (adenine-specific) n=1 Tax=marine sediment metagenome TaxID=412755 RepID=A0A0F9HWL6_9ZZZZ
MTQLTLYKMEPVKSDVVYTPDYVAKEIVDWIKPSGKCLDPCKGDGAFLRALSADTEWCEIIEDRDFFDYTNKVDWIIGNPPYSIFEEWLRHSFEISDNVVYILPTNKVFQRQVIMDMINSWGGIKAIMVYGSGNTVGFPFGFSVGTFHFCRNWKGFCDLKLTRKALLED